MNPLDPSTKQQVMDMLNAGEEVKDIAVKTGVARSTIYTWKDRLPVDTRFHDPKLKEKAIALRRNLVPVKLISEQLGVPAGTIYEWLRSQPKTIVPYSRRPPPEPRPRDPQLKRRVYELRASGISAREIAKEINIPIQTVYFWLAQARTRAKTIQEKLYADLQHLSEANADDPNLSATLLRLSRSAKAVLSGMSM